MKFCQGHWDRLREAIETRGIADLIAPDGHVALEQMADQLNRAEAGEEPSTPVNYDPLMAAHWAIINNVSEAGGPGCLLHMISTPDCCPLCFANEQHEAICTEPGCTFTFDDWIDRAADDQLAHVKTMRGD